MSLVSPESPLLRYARIACWCVSYLLIASSLSQAAEPAIADNTAGVAFFEAKIRPVLVAHCYQCHSVAAGKSEGELLLDSRDSVRSGGSRGAAVVPRDAAASLLLTAITHEDADLKMPPKKAKLPATVIADFKAWIAMGAPDPRESDVVAKAKPPVDLAAGREFWAFKRSVASPLPKTKNATWAKRDLDHYILAKLEAAGLAPSPDAEPATLLRRLHFDLVGLPPSPDALEQFAQRAQKDGLDAAIRAEADTLLASPQFGERWGRHWLDVARFAESSGKEANISFPYAWRYRDYVIDAVNADLPFDRFLLEQIAGDQLPYENDQERARLLIATGFLALGPKNLDEANPKQFAADVIDEQIDTLTRAVLGQSIACARCHDHKFDPFPMSDYYAMAGMFISTKTYFGTAVSPSNRIGGDPLVLPRDAGQKIFHPSITAERVKSLHAELAKLKQQEVTGMAAAKKAMETGGDPEKFFTLTDALRIFWTSGNIEGQLEKVNEQGEALPLAMGVLDGEKVVDAPLLARGEVDRPGETVPRAFPKVMELASAKPPPADASGRLQLAQWLTQADHPLTARVISNRVWSHLFGEGLVRTVDNFGFSGERPMHPELLDHLALDLQKNQWSLKQLVREIVNSRAYRQASTHNDKTFASDPENRLLWRMSKRRLDAEAIRDAMLVAAGELDSNRPEGSLVAKKIGDRPISLIGLDASLPTDLDGSLHRSVYLPVLRDRLPEVLDLFDFAEPSLVTGHRETTNVPLQALYLLNGTFVTARAKGLASRLQREADNHDARIRRAFLLCLSRKPDEAELKLATAFFAKAENLAGQDESARQSLLAVYCQALLSTAEFRNLD